VGCQKRAGGDLQKLLIFEKLASLSLSSKMLVFLSHEKKIMQKKILDLADIFLAVPDNSPFYNHLF